MNTVTEPRGRIRPGALAAFGLALLLHAGWWFAWGRSWTLDFTPVPLAEHPRLAYLPPTPLQAEARLLGSPALFALPHAVGFSGDENRGRDRAPSALQVAPRDPRLLARPGDKPPAPDYLRSLRQTVVETGTELPWTPTATRAFSTPAGATGFVVRVYWPDGAPAVRGGLPGAGVLAPVLQDKPWELAAMLVFDEQGGVRNVFIEKPTTSRERNEAITRALRAVRIDSGGQESRARVVVQYDQDGGPKAPAGGAVRP